METNKIDVLNKILTNTLEYIQILQNLTDSITHPPTLDKLNQLKVINEEESEKLIKVISGLGGDVQTSERLTDQEAINWISSPILNNGDITSVWEHLIEAERNKEDDYKNVLTHHDIDRETKNTLKPHLKKTESNITDYQSTLHGLE
ncbi:hypothetical protein [Allomuricauda sp. F6463D]|uniref:hypothetical protein n=1 Tax=Allomuricauda sp. F6463D TaxID=2926409 RepID=UPI001FF12302|nr:hypothetical protein [Muricauda sp. F6463D]MCK0159170.1 hypothetical protein [Muricauda sp. F6463D]